VSEDDDLSFPDEKANILIVDDRSDKRLVFQTVLEDLGQNIVTARSGEEALRWLLDHECAVILLDVNMPGMDGLETAELIRGRRKSAHTPIIFITAYADEMHTARGYLLGAVDYILAPVLPNVLRSKVNAFVRLFNLTSQLRRQADARIALAKEQAARAAAEDSTRHAVFLAKASLVMSSSLDVDAILKGATQLVVSFFADFCSLSLLNEDGSLRQVESAYSKDWKPLSKIDREVLDEVVGETITRVASTGVRQIVPGLHLAPVGSSTRAGQRVLPGGKALPFRQMGVFPLIAGGRTRGVMALLVGPSALQFGLADLVLAEEVAGRVAMALDNCLLYQEIQQADRRKNEFLATLAHELRNPLAPLRTALHAIRHGGTTEQEIDRLQTMMDRQVDHMAHLVDDLMDVARITSGKIELRKERVDLVYEIRHAIDTCRATEDASAREFSVSLPQEPLMIEADRHRLQQILENILMNAVKYTEAGGYIGVTALRDGSQAVITVRDNGIGIAPDMLPGIWELFMQVDGTNRMRKGLGIGLSLAKRMVHLHGGSIEAHSEGLERGSTFTVRLPCAMESEGPTVAAEVSRDECALPENAKRILIVDDNADAAESLKLVLNLMGHQAELALEGVEALRMAEKFRPEIIFLDIELPGMNGYEIATRMRRDLGMTETRLIALSGFSSEEYRRRSVQTGFDAHIVKPLDPDKLPEILAKFGGASRGVVDHV
jgi:signal transduction histidine kinase/DNA-binding response OmpR family regulator